MVKIESLMIMNSVLLLYHIYSTCALLASSSAEQIEASFVIRHEWMIITDKGHACPVVFF